MTLGTHTTWIGEEIADEFALEVVWPHPLKSLEESMSDCQEDVEEDPTAGLIRSIHGPNGHKKAPWIAK